eukprot:m.79945 g.79945  ORF g.79945 m.79945 type:complete len:684 (+) comp11998_c0_seq2:19-2070(+)
MEREVVIASSLVVVGDEVKGEDEGRKDQQPSLPLSSSSSTSSNCTSRTSSLDDDGSSHSQSSYYYETETVADDGDDSDEYGEDITLIQNNTKKRMKKHKHKRNKRSSTEHRVDFVRDTCIHCCNSFWLELVIWFVLVLAVSIVVVSLVLKQKVELSPEDEACMVYCEGDILSSVSKYKLFNDSKIFVDLPMAAHPKVIIKAFSKLTDVNANTVRKFVDEYFDGVGSDQETWVPPHFPSRPVFYDNLYNETMKGFAVDVHNIWKLLGRRVKTNVSETQEQNSLIYLPHPYVVPGGRFREVYYWDTFWIVRGLIQSGLTDVVRGIIGNYFHLLDTFGFIPNGNRVYYLTRSQPPLLSEMVMALYEATGNETDLEIALPYLEKEYSYWNTTDAKQANFDGVRLTKYGADTTKPRPESFAEDTTTASAAGMDEDQQRQFFKNVATGAETGWDFSSRWFADKQHLYSIRAADVVPVDLNVFLLRYEKNLMTIAQKVSGDPSKSSMYRNAMYSRGSAMVTMMFNVSTCAFHDVLYSTGEQIPSLTAANYFPLWAGNIFDDGIQSCLFMSLQSSAFIQAGGIDTTLVHTGQQWDKPNAWAPIQWILAKGLDAVGTVEGRKLALKIKCNWLKTTLIAYNNTGFMYEKYNATEVGKGGGGGEYTPQLGFGWTNGVVLDFLADIAGSYNILCF